MIRTVLSVLALLWSLVAIGSTCWAIAYDRYTPPVAPGLIALENLEHRLFESGETSASITLSRAEAIAAVEFAEKEMVARDRSTYAHLLTSIVLCVLALAVFVRGRFEPARGVPDSEASPPIAESPSN